LIIKSNSRKAAIYSNIFPMSEPPLEEEDQEGGLYVGKTSIYKLPFFLNQDRLINPHISVLGMTGSGKTYLVKSLIARYRLFKEHNVLIIDWNSEYTGLVSHLHGRTTKVEVGRMPSVSEVISGLNSIDLSAVGDGSEKLSLASTFLAGLLKFMLSLGPDRRLDTVVVIDEAWKLLNFDKNIGKLFREGRKFGFAVIAATQLLNDVDNEVLANAACSFVFRLQGSENFERLVSSELIDEDSVGVVRSLKRGSCLVSLAYKGRDLSRRFVVDRVSGFSMGNYSINGDKLVVNISAHKLGAVLDDSHLSSEAKVRIGRFFEENSKGVDLQHLVTFLFAAGLGRPDIFSLARALGINDAAVAMAMEVVKC